MQLLLFSVDDFQMRAVVLSCASEVHKYWLYGDNQVSRAGQFSLLKVRRGKIKRRKGQPLHFLH